MQPNWLIMQAFRAIRQNRNNDQITQARHMQLYDSAHRDHQKSKTPNLLEFVPHPIEYQMFQGGMRLSITKTAAKEVMRDIADGMPSGFRVLIRDLEAEISAIANGYQ